MPAADDVVTNHVNETANHHDTVKRRTVLFTIAIIALLVLLGVTMWQHAVLKLRVAFANEQTLIFSEMRTKALQSNAAGAAGCLQYVVWYYPSGTKQEPGTRLDSIVERDRALAIHDIIAYLRSKTGEDLGTNAEPWIKKFAPN